MVGVAQVRIFGGKADVGTVEPEADLLERAKRDPQAFGVLYDRHIAALSTYVYRRTGDAHTTEDLVADTFLIAAKSLRHYRYRGVPFRFWLLRIATNVVNRWARRQRRRATVFLLTDQIADRSSTDPRGDVDLERLQRALLSLSPSHQAVLSLYHLEGLSVKETASVIGCREGTVRSRLARARDALRQKLNDMEAYPCKTR